VITLIVIMLMTSPLSSSARYGLSKPSPDCRFFVRLQGKPIPFEARLDYLGRLSGDLRQNLTATSRTFNDTGAAVINP